MAKCNWDPSKHEGRPCPIHGSGMWDENVLTRKDKIEKLKEKGYTQEEIEEELKGEKFDDDFDWEEKEEVKEDFDKDEDDAYTSYKKSGDEKYANDSIDALNLKENKEAQKIKQDFVNRKINVDTLHEKLQNISNINEPPLKKQLSQNEFNELVQKDFSTLSDEHKDD